MCCIRGWRVSMCCILGILCLALCQLQLRSTLLLTLPLLALDCRRCRWRGGLRVGGGVLLLPPRFRRLMEKYRKSTGGGYVEIHASASKYTASKNSSILARSLPSSCASRESSPNRLPPAASLIEGSVKVTTTHLAILLLLLDEAR